MHLNATTKNYPILVDDITGIIKQISKTF